MDGYRCPGKGKTGWVRMLYIRRGASGENASAATEASGVLGLATGRAGSGNVVAATGVRGLDEEDLKEAEFNENEFHITENLSDFKETGPRICQSGRIKNTKSTVHTTNRRELK